MSNYTLNDVKPLTIDQYDMARAAALERVKRRIGKRPRRVDYARELGPLWGVVDVLALVIFLAALVISSLHIRDYVAVSVGVLGVELVINQVAYIFLAEASMILFMVMHQMTSAHRQGRPAMLRPFSIYLILAGLAAVFIFVANLASGVGWLLSIMPPVFTIGIAFNLERLIVASIHRRDDINARYLAALADYETATHDPENHPRFEEYVIVALWEKLASLKPNKQFRDAPPGFKVAAARRELAREQWHQAAPVDQFIGDTTLEQESFNGLPFGNIPPDQAAPGYTLPMRPVNGHIDSARNKNETK